VSDDFGLKDSEARLWHLIAERAQPDADVTAIDRRIWDLFGEDWAVMFTDLSGFSRQVEAFGILHFLQVIYEQKRLLLPIVSTHDGILVKTEADSFLLLFRRPDTAMRCAIAMQAACARHNQRRVPEEHVLLCLGIGYGRVLRIGDADVYGAEVNAASKLGEDTAKAGQILVTRAVKDALEDPSGLGFSPISDKIPGSIENFDVSYPKV